MGLVLGDRARWCVVGCRHLAIRARLAATVIYLSGVVREDLPAKAGLMLTPRCGYRPRQVGERFWAADNGCFAHPESFNLDRYLRWLAKHVPHAGRCLFATAPDVPGDWSRTLDRFVATLSAMQSSGFPVALCAQNGATVADVPWDDIDCLFIGGRPEVDDRGRPREWKTSPAAWALIAEAKRRGKHVHQGRVNSLRRLRTAQMQGADSVDGTFLQRAPSFNIPVLQRWIDDLDRQPLLWTAV